MASGKSSRCREDCQKVFQERRRQKDDKRLLSEKLQEISGEPEEPYDADKLRVDIVVGDNEDRSWIRRIHKGT